MAPSDSDALIVGRNPVVEALERGDRSLEKVLLAKTVQGRFADVVRRAARAAGVPVQVVPPQRIDQLARGLAHQGVAAVASPVAYADLDAMLAAIAPDLDTVQRTKPVVVALDGIEDPHNFGAILRSAVAAGAAGVVVPERGMAPLSATTIKASAGTADRLPIARVTNLAEALHQMKERGYWVAGLDGSGDETVWTADFDRALVLVVGSEGSGMRPRVRETCDFVVSIPLRGPAESLNASVATGVALFAAVRGRGT